MNSGWNSGLSLKAFDASINSRPHLILLFLLMNESSFLLELCSIYTGIFLAALMVIDRAKPALVFALVLSMLGMVVFKR